MSVITQLQQAASFYSSGNLDGAESICQKILQKIPKNADALHIVGLVRLQRADTLAAVECLSKAFKLSKDNEQIKTNYVNALYSHANNLAAGAARYMEALSFFDLALKYRPRFPEALNNRGMALLELKEFEEAEKTFKKLLDIAPDYPYASGWLMHAKLFSCSWDGFDKASENICEGIKAGKRMDTPFALWSFVDDGAIQKLCAQQFYRDNFARFSQNSLPFKKAAHNKIRVAYISADFRWHAVAFLMSGVFEHHDKSRFEFFGISIGPDDGSDYAKRIRSAFDHVYECGEMRDDELFRLLRSLDIDIAVDLTGFSANSRPAIFAARCAPVQINYLGYPGTMGAECMDYILADKFIIPEESRQFYTEKIIYLPDSFQANDDKRVIAEKKPTRNELGLPEEGFVFCSFNHAHKLTPDIFAIWMRLLSKAPDSVLWMYADNDLAKNNLCKQAALAGIDSSRLIFAGKADYPHHLARLGCADLFLDSYPFNAGTTASDALWAGLPILTCAGQAFASRMAGSLLYAVGLPELITNNLEEYEEMACRLVNDRSLLDGLRQHLAKNRTNPPLFDTVKFCRNLESAYQMAHRRVQMGLLPADIIVEGF